MTKSTTKKRAKREEYTEIIKYISARSNLSYTKVTTILSQYSKELQMATKRGEILELDGICTIKFTTKVASIYSNIKFDIKKQAKYVQHALGYSAIEVYNCINLYMIRIKELIEKGYRVNIKGIGYIEPVFNEKGTMEIKQRVSPMLEKPEIAEFVLMDKGDIYIETLTQKDLRFKMILNANLKLPKRLLSAEETKLNLEYVDV